MTIIPIFVPHKGCPNDCVFCNQKKISGQQEEMTGDKMTDIIQTHLKSIKRHPDRHVEIAFYGGSFTAIDRSVAEGYLKTASKYIEDGSVDEIRISTRPDCIDKDILNMLSGYGVKTIELGVQSLDDEVLAASCRGHNARCVYESAALIKSMGFRLGIQTMTGLPGDTREKCLDTVRKVIAIGPEIVRIYPVLVIKGTELERQYERGAYIPQKLEEAVELCAELLYMYEENGIKVIRIGLQATENIREGSGSDVAAGPVHPAFRQFVESRLSLARIEKIIGSQGLAGMKQLTILTGISNISNVIGQKRTNIEYLKKHYRFENIKVLPSHRLDSEIEVAAST